MTGSDPTLPLPPDRKPERKPEPPPEDRTVLAPGNADRTVAGAGADPTAMDRTLRAGDTTQGDPGSGPRGPDGTRVLPVIPDVALTRELGRGGMGIVYHGRQPYLDREVAVKLLTEALRGTDYAARFQREARLLAGIHHPHIVACYQAGLTTVGDCYLVMEFVDGPDLRRWIDEHGPLTTTEAVALCRDLAQALGYANDQGIIHRDVKPENVLLHRDARAAAGAAFPWIAKLADLGLARRESSGESNHLTARGAVMGTPATMAPEQFEDPDHVDFRADMYGLGCILFHALTGRPAFQRGTMATIFKEKSDGKVPDPRRDKADLPGPVAKLTRRLLERRPQDRFASYTELVAECERVLEALRPAPSLAPPPRRGPWLLVAGVAAAVLGGAALWWTTRPNAPQSQPQVDSRPDPQPSQPRVFVHDLVAWHRPDFPGTQLFPGTGMERTRAWGKLGAEPPFTSGADEPDNAITIQCLTGTNGHTLTPRSPRWRVRGWVELRETRIGRQPMLPREATVRVEIADHGALTVAIAGRDRPQVTARWQRREGGQSVETPAGKPLPLAAGTPVCFLCERGHESVKLGFAPGDQGADGQELEFAAPPGATVKLVIAVTEGLAGFRDFVLEERN